MKLVAGNTLLSENLFEYKSSPNAPTPVTVCDKTHENSRNFTVKIDDVFWKNHLRIKNGFLSSTYEVYRRRLPLIKIVNEGVKVLILLFVAFDYEYLF